MTGPTIRPVMVPVGPFATRDIICEACHREAIACVCAGEPTISSVHLRCRYYHCLASHYYQMQKGTP